MNKIVTLAFSLILTFGSLFSQKIDYDNSSKWYLGFNFGGTWQTTDVANRTSGGWGLTLGRSYNYNYGRRLTFDIRGRYLGGYWYGQDLKVTDSAGYTGVPLKPYMDSLGFAVNNFQTELHNLSLELVLHANGVRERSGWDPYIFGGIGVKWYQTYGDLYFNDSLGGIYNYDPSMLSKTYVNTLSDGVYETALEGSTQDKFTVGLMPSLGFGIGYQVGKRVTLGLEHKTTFTLTDDFDGFVADGKYKQDLYHYTSAFINFRFRRGGRGGGGSTGGGVGNIDNYNNNTNNLTGCNPPVVTYIQPSSVGMNVNTMSYVVVADVKDVIGKENITFKHNGLNTLNFTYNPTTDRLEAQVILTPGSNTFEIYATNTCGSDTEGLNVNYQNCVAPVISLVSPSGTSTSVSTTTFAFSAFVTSVDNPNGLTLTVNNRSVTNYTMNSTTGSLQATLNLIPGVNTVVVTATNACGTASETITINYQNCVPPVITVLNPATSGTTVNSSTYTFNASVQNVTSSQGITLKLNTASIPNFSFNATTGVVQNNVTLKPGLNTFVLTATNSCGTDTETVTINYVREMNNTGGNTGGGNTGGGTQEEKITICHYPPGNNGNPQTIEIPLSAWPAHQAHGDKLGPCPEVNNNNGGGNGNNGNGNNGGGNEKITICHYPPGNNGNPQTIEIPLSAWPAHQAHGDKLGPCPEVNNNNGGGNGNNGNGNTGGGNEKITICHYPPGNNGNPQTIEIPLSAWPAHQAHGDKLGPCPEVNNNNGGGNGNNGNGNTGGGNEKITICHYPPGNNGNPQTIEIPLSAWPAHQAHGDKLGPCDNSGNGNGNNGNGNNGNNGSNGNGNNGGGTGNANNNGGNQGSGNNGNNGGGTGNTNNNGGNQGSGNTNENNGGNGNAGTGGSNGNNGGNNGSGSNNGGGNGNNGHGNNADGIDSSNPGQGNGGPGGGVDGSGDDENGNGNSGTGGSNGTAQSGNQGTSNGNSGSGSGNGSNGSTGNGSEGSSNGGNSSNENGSGQGNTENGSGSGNGSNGSTGNGSEGSSNGGNSSNENGSGQGNNENGSGSGNGSYGSTGNGSEGSSNGGNSSNENGSGQGNTENGSGNGSNGSTGSGSEGSTNEGNSSNENGSGQGNTENGSGSGNSSNGSTGNGSNGSNNNGSGSSGNGGNGGNGGGSNKTKSTTAGSNKGSGVKPAVKPAGTKVNDQKPGTPKPADKNETKPSGTETKPEGGKTETQPVKPTEIKPGTGGGKGGKQ